MQMISKSALVLAATVALGPKVVHAGAWQSVATGCVTQDGTQPIPTGLGLSFSPSAAGSITVYCPITTADVEGSPFRLAIYFQDPDGSGSSQVQAAVYRMDKRASNNGAVSTVCLYRSSADGDTNDMDFQIDTEPCFTAASPADPNTYLYYAIVTLFRATNAPVPIFYGLELYR
jgi:hypothetical protein